MAKLHLDSSKLLYHLDRVQEWKQGDEIFPVHVELSPSSACNQKCILCCVDYRGHKPSFLSREVLLDLADDFGRHGVRSVLLAGEGEPMLNKAIPDFVVRCLERKVDVALNSNAVLFKREAAETMLPGLVWARFTIQSPDPDTYAKVHATDKEDLQKAVENLRTAVEIKKQRGLPVTLGIQQILINENWEHVYENCKLAKDIGVDYFTIKRFSKHPKNDYNVPEDLYKQCIDQFKRCEELSDENFTALIRWNQFSAQCVRNYRKCIGLHFITQILADGSVYPCCQYFGDKSKCFGNINEKQFSEIWTGAMKRKVIKWVEDEVDVDKCYTYCRHHSTNIFLWQFMEEPMHVNFI